MAFESLDFSKYRTLGMVSYEKVSHEYQKKQENYHEIEEVFTDFCALLLSKEDAIVEQFNQLGEQGQILKSIVKELITENEDFIRKLFVQEYSKLEDHYHELFVKQQNNLSALNDSLNKEYDQRVDLQVDLDQLTEQFRQQKIENQQLMEDLHLADCKLNTDSTNSNLPPSSDRFKKQKKKKATDKKKKPVYNTREKTDRRPGAQKGHKGSALTNQQVLELINSGKLEHEIINIGNITGDNYKSGYILDLKITPVVKEIRIPDHENLPHCLWGGPNYGSTISSLAILLGTEGLLGYNRTARIINELSNNVLSISEGKIYEINESFFELALPEYFKIKDQLKNAPILYTDATHFDVNNSRCWIRNHSYEDLVLYWPTPTKKNIELKENPLLNDFDNILVHDHETGLYNLTCDHAECNIHLIRHLKKMALLTNHQWLELFRELLVKYDHRRNIIKNNDQKPNEFSHQALKNFKLCFDQIIKIANKENKKLKSEKIRKKERALINRIQKYYTEHTLFLNNFDLDFTNNRSERDLRIITRKRKMINTFRNFHGLEMFCVSLSIVESHRKQEKPVLQGIQKIFNEVSPF